MSAWKSKSLFKLLYLIIIIIIIYVYIVSQKHAAKFLWHNFGNTSEICQQRLIN